MDHRLDKEFYEEFYGRFKEPQTVTSCNHYKLYLEVLKYLRPDERFVDLGCGDGAFIELAESMGFSPMSGVDSCHNATALARKRQVQALIMDYDIMDLEYRGIGCDTFTVLETFEHLQNDLDLMLLFMLRESGKRIVFTVPNFDSVGHARYFEVLEQVERRYNPDKITEYCGIKRLKYYICEMDPKRCDE